MPKYLSVSQAANHITLAKSTLYEYVHYRKIPFIKIGQRIVFETAALDKWMKKHAKKEVILK
jgi:excisionase family DNA binding protein